MCGIAGIVGQHVDSTDPRSLIRRMVASLHHRGPDEKAIYVGPNVALGSARLSIIDIEGGHQPIHNEDGTIWCVYNGETFNFEELTHLLKRRGHRFKTRSDTETLVHAYEEFGIEFVERLNGQFAFAIWDSNRQCLILGRDRLGIRPLFWTHRGPRLYFASEIKSLFQAPEVPRELDSEGIDQTLVFWTQVPPCTSFKGIYELPAGHLLISDHSGARLHRYWELPFDGDQEASLTEDEAAESLREQLTYSVRTQLKSDVPVGAYLSGGIDSTVLCTLMKDLVSGPFQVFSIGFEDEAFDEGAAQETVVRSLGVRATRLTCRCQDIAQVFPEVVYHAERPLIRTAPAPLYLLSRLVRDSGMKVVMTGEGADEILLGYNIFKELLVRQFWSRQPTSQTRPLLLKKLFHYLPQYQGKYFEFTKAFYTQHQHDPQDPFFSHRVRWNMGQQLQAFRCLNACDSSTQEVLRKSLNRLLPADWSRRPPMSRAQWLEINTLLHGYLLCSQGDRMSMAHSVEGRYPFLDHHLVEFCLKLPRRYHLKGLKEKCLLKRAFGSKIPESIVRRSKQPYRAPDWKCFQGPGTPDYVPELLSESHIKRSGIFQWEKIERLLNKLTQTTQAELAPRDNLMGTVVLSTQLLYHQFVASFQPQPTPSIEEIPEVKKCVEKSV